MNKVKKILSIPGISLAAFILAIVLLAGSSIGGARAALTYYSEDYVANVALQEIGVELIEEGNIASGGNLLAHFAQNDEIIKPGQTYTEQLAVRNTGTIGEYVRVSVYKYWMKDGEKLNDLSPALIGLHFTGNGWVEDEAASTAERSVWYYTSVLPVGEDSSLFADTLTIDRAIATKVRLVTEGNVTTAIYEYDGAQFCVEASVDAVQEHNAQAAIKSAWGVDVNISGNGALSLAN